MSKTNVVIVLDQIGSFNSYKNDLKKNDLKKNDLLGSEQFTWQRELFGMKNCYKK